MPDNDEQTMTHGMGASGMPGGSHVPEDGTLSLPGQAPTENEGTLSLPGQAPGECEGTLSLKPSADVAERTLSHPGEASRNSPGFEGTLSLPSDARSAGPDRGGPLIWKVGDFIDGKYEVTGIIGQGGMGIVYKVMHREWNVEMAVKTPLPTLVRDTQAKARFFREAQTWVDLGLHPNIVQCWYVRELSGLPRLFADYISGGSLKNWVQSGAVKPGQWLNIIDVVLQACDGLEYAHERGVVHRDVKPGNLLMTPDGRLCVTDFGLVKLAGMDDIPSSPASNTLAEADISSGLTLTGSVMGTPEYGAPEQWGEARHVDARADIYALGIVLYELCCGRRPFDDGKHRESAQAIIGRHLSSQPPDPRTFKSDVPIALAEIALRCLAKKPNARPQHMRELREALAKVYSSIAGVQPREAPKVAEARAAILNNRAVSLWDLNKHDEAFQAWNEALTLDPHHPESVFNKSLLEWRAARITDHDAEERLRATHDPARRVRLFLGYLNLERLAAEEAEADLVEALADAANANDGAAWRALGHARLSQHKFDLAAEAYLRAQKLIPKDEIITECQSLIAAAKAANATAPAPIFPRRYCVRSIEKNVGSIRALATTTDGKYLLGARGDYTLGLWDLPWGNFIRGYEHSKEINATVVTPDGRYILTGGGDANLHLWEIAHERENRNFFGKGHVGAVKALVLTADGSQIVTGGRDKSVRIWNYPAGTLLKTLWGHEESVEAVAVSRDSRLIVSASEDRSIRLWNTVTGESRTLTSETTISWRAIWIDPTEKWIVAGGTDGALVIFDLGSLRAIKRFSGHRGTVLIAKVTPDGRFLLSGGDDYTLRLWDIATGRCLRTYSGHSGALQALALSSDGQMVFSGALDNINRPLRCWQLSLPPLTFGCSEAAGLSATLAPLAVCRVESQAQSQEANATFQTHLDSANSAFKTKDYATVYLELKEARNVSGYERDPRALALNAQLSNALPRTTLAAGYPRRNMEGHGKGTAVVALSNNQQYLLSVGNDEKSVRMMDLATGQHSGTFEGHTRPVNALALTSDNRFLITASADDTLRTWALSPDGKCLRTFAGHKDAVLAVALSRDGRLAVSGSYDRTVAVWEMASGRRIRVFEGHAEPVKTVTVTPDGRLAASGCRDGTIKLWSFATGAALKTFNGHVGEVNAIAITSNGRTLLSAGEDKSLRAWNIETGQCETIFKGSQGPVNSLAITQDGRFVFSGALEGPQTPLRCWQILSGQCVRTFGSHPRGIFALAVSNDGSVLISGGAEGPIKTWDLEWELDPGAKASARTIQMADTQTKANPFDFDFKPAATKVSSRTIAFDPPAIPPPPVSPLPSPRIPPPPPPAPGPVSQPTRIKKRLFEDTPPSSSPPPAN